MHLVSCHLQGSTEALLDLGSKVNAMSLAFAEQLGLMIYKINIAAQKIDGTILDTYKMVVSTFFVSNKDGRERFLKRALMSFRM